VVTRTHFRFRIDVWTANSESIVGHVAGIEDYELVLGTFRLACERWPRVPITLRHGARVGAHHISALYEYDLSVRGHCRGRHDSRRRPHYPRRRRWRVLRPAPPGWPAVAHPVGPPAPMASQSKTPQQ
jgi:hypothetical protein